ncbi:PREDICTED: CWF19-like protein 2 [Crocodylus porosus]|uniref:CWF19-like protein 2 n=1 Tax=Crocodylus porosus TaxID=8502 RepID=UPI00093BDB3F|nr:PREDICTED: CWF19-like protein 2 [Crocodylus porosus]
MPKDETPQVLSDEEMNRLGARILKAELMGNMDLASKLQAQLENARKLKESRTQTPSKSDKEAKADYEKEERCKELKRLRGEDTWMLDDVNKRVEELEKEHSVKKKQKKDKHSRKPKKEKKSKKQKIEKKDESSDSSSGSSFDWVESNASQSSSTEKTWKISTEQLDTSENPALQRDEWMTFDFMAMKTTSVASLKAEKQKEKILEQERAREIEQVQGNFTNIVYSLVGHILFFLIYFSHCIGGWGAMGVKVCG